MHNWTNSIEKIGLPESVLLRRVRYVLYAAVGLGVLGFIVSLATGSPAGWHALLVNTLFFSGLAYGSLMLSIVVTITNARWGRPFKRLAESTVFFIPISWLLFGVLFLGMDHFFKWTDPMLLIPAKGWWLNKPFFIARQTVALLVTGTIGMIYVRRSVLPDLAAAGNSNEAPSPGVHRQNRVLAPILALSYAAMACLIAVDWMMSTDHDWYSTMFGVQYVVANLYAGWAFLLILSVWFNWKRDLDRFLSTDRHNDLSRLVFALSIFWTYLMFSQVLVIWYANIPEETAYLALRLDSRWSDLGMFIIVTLFFIPFFGLISRFACRSKRFTALVSVVILVGLWSEKVYLVMPSILDGGAVSGASGQIGESAVWIAVTLGIAGLFLLGIQSFLSRYPALPVSDPLLSLDEGHGCID